MLYLSARDIEAVGLPPDAVRRAVEAVYAALAREEARAPPKLALDLGAGRTVQAMAAALTGPGLAAVKWASVVPAGEAPGPTVKASILLTDIASGEAVALLDGAWITAARTAAMSALAASRLAQPDAVSIAFIGCGVQARSHLTALADVLPRLRTVTAFSRTRESAERFAREAEAMGFRARVESDSRLAVADCDVVVTSVPAGPGVTPFLDPAWFAPQSFVAAVDLGRSIRPERLGRFATIATDDRAQSEALVRAGKLLGVGPFDVDLAELVGGKPIPHRVSSLFVFAGHALADLATAAAVYAAAQTKGIGLRLPE